MLPIENSFVPFFFFLFAVSTDQEKINSFYSLLFQFVAKQREREAEVEMEKERERERDREKGKEGVKEERKYPRLEVYLPDAVPKAFEMVLSYIYTDRIYPAGVNGTCTVTSFHPLWI